MIFKPVRLLEFNPFPYSRLTVAEAETAAAIQDAREDVETIAEESCREEHLYRVEQE